MEQVDESAVPVTPEAREIVGRLRRLEGQVRGLQSMVTEGRECDAVVTQFLAVRAALDEVGARIVDREVSQCLSRPEADRGQLGKMIRLWLRLSH